MRIFYISSKRLITIIYQIKVNCQFLHAQILCYSLKLLFGFYYFTIFLFARSNYARFRFFMASLIKTEAFWDVVMMVGKIKKGTQ